MIITNKEKAKEIGKKYARQYHHNTFEGGLKNNEFLFSDEECMQSALEMAKWKDKQSKLKEKQLIEECINNCAVMLLDIDIILRKKGLKGQFEEEFDNEYKKFKKAMEE